MKPQDILVTGGQGALGSVLGHAGCHAVPRTVLDITDPTEIAAVLETRKPALVINAAAYTAVDRAESEPDLAHRINAVAAGNLAKLCAAASIPLIHISTDMVFSEGDPAQPMAESSWATPNSVYGQTKLEGETLVRAAGGQALIARVSWLFSQSHESFITRIITAARKHDHLDVVADEIGRPTPAEALTGQLIELAGQLQAGQSRLPPVLHLGPPGPVSRHDWARDIFEVTAAAGGPSPSLSPVPASTYNTPATRPRGVVLDVGLADRLIGPMDDWTPYSNKLAEALAGTQ